VTRARRAAATTLLLVALAGPGTPAQGQVDGGVDPAGVTITIVRWQGRHFVHATGAGGADDPSGCDWDVVLAPLGALPPADIGPWRPDSHLGLLRCNGVGVRVLWVGPHNTVDLAVEARRRVEEYVARIPVPEVAVHANPDPGLVGFETWLWASGYDGRPVVDRIDALGFTVDVRIEPTPVRWAFGDGDATEGDLGRPYPVRSSVRHGYAEHGPVAVRASLDLVPRYRVDGTAWIRLPAIEVADSLPYRVREAQAVIIG
jgi:hypothetical protein